MQGPEHVRTNGSRSLTDDRANRMRTLAQRVKFHSYRFGGHHLQSISCQDEQTSTMDVD